MRLSETIYINPSKELSKLCHLAKNLYNLANWYVRQDFFKLNNFLSYYDLDYILKNKQAYRSLPSQTSQQILKLVNRNWKSYFGALKEYRASPKKFRTRHRIPSYKKKNGEFIAVFTNQQCKIKEGYLIFPKKVNLKLVKTRITEKLKEVKIIPMGIKYKIVIVYEKEKQDLGFNINRMLSIDLGLNNLITAVNNIGLDPIIIKGKVVKSINHYYNKQLAHYRRFENKKNNFQDTKRIQKLHLKRYNKINTIFHRISRSLIKYCIKNNLGTIIIGYNYGWKQNSNLGKKNNQNFVQIPFLRLINQIKYKSEMIGITVIMINENHTSKCSFFDNEDIRHHKKYKGKRISRGLFRTSNGTLINADVNAGYNIMKKTFPNAISVDGIKVLGLMPQIIQQNIVDTII